MAALDLAFLGPVRVTVGDKPFHDFQTRKVRALLFYLATERSPGQSGVHGRETLLELLWPGMPEKSARHNLRQIIYHLRQALPEIPRRQEVSGAEWGATVPLLLTGHSERTWGLAFSPDGSRLVTSGAHGVVKMWDVESGEEIRSFVGHRSTVSTVAFSHDGRRLASRAGSETVRLWDVASGQSLLSVTGPGTQGLTFTPDGTQLVTGNDDGTVHDYTLDIEESVAPAKDRLTRTPARDECRQYRIDPCLSEQVVNGAAIPVQVENESQ